MFLQQGINFRNKKLAVKSVNRNLIPKEEYIGLLNELEIIHKKLNAYIKVLKLNLHNQKTPSTRTNKPVN